MLCLLCLSSRVGKMKIDSIGVLWLAKKEGRFRNNGVAHRTETKASGSTEAKDYLEFCADIKKIEQ